MGTNKNDQKLTEKVRSSSETASRDNLMCNRIEVVDSNMNYVCKYYTGENLSEL